MGEQFSQAGVQFGGTVLTGRCPSWGKSSHRQISSLGEQFSQAGVQFGGIVLTGRCPTWGNSSHRQGQLGGTVLTGRCPTWRNSSHRLVSNLGNSSERQVTILSNLGEQFSQAGVQLWRIVLTVGPQTPLHSSCRYRSLGLALVNISHRYRVRAVLTPVF